MLTFKERYLIEVGGINSISDLKALSDYHSKKQDLFNKSAPFMKPEERQTVYDNQHELGQSIDQKWSDRFSDKTNQTQEPAQTPDLGKDLMGDMPNIDSVTGPVSGLADMFK